MTIKLRCGACNTPLQAKDQLAGRQLKCPKCDVAVRVPHGRNQGVASSAAGTSESRTAAKRPRSEDLGSAHQSPPGADKGKGTPQLEDDEILDILGSPPSQPPPTVYPARQPLGAELSDEEPKLAPAPPIAEVAKPCRSDGNVLRDYLGESAPNTSRSLPSGPSKAPMSSGFLSESLQEVWNAATFRSSDFAFELWSVIAGWWFAGIIVWFIAGVVAETTLGATFDPGLGRVIAVFVGSAIGAVVGCILTLAIEVVLFGLALRICGATVPEPAEGVDIVWDIVKWKLGWLVIATLFLFCIPPITLLGSLVVFVFLPASVYSQRLTIPFGKSLVAAVVVQVLGHGIAFMFLAAFVFLVASVSALS